MNCEVHSYFFIIDSEVGWYQCPGSGIFNGLFSCWLGAHAESVLGHVPLWDSMCKCVQ